MTLPAVVLLCYRHLMESKFVSDSEQVPPNDAGKASFQGTFELKCIYVLLRVFFFPLFRASPPCEGCLKQQHAGIRFNESRLSKTTFGRFGGFFKCENVLTFGGVSMVKERKHWLQFWTCSGELLQHARFTWKETDLRSVLHLLRHQRQAECVNCWRAIHTRLVWFCLYSCLMSINVMSLLMSLRTDAPTSCPKNQAYLVSKRGWICWFQVWCCIEEEVLLFISTTIKRKKLNWSSISISNKNKEIFLLTLTAPIQQNCNYVGYVSRILLVPINFSLSANPMCLAHSPKHQFSDPNP